MARLRTARVRIGDTLQSLALRELGEAQRWREIADLNRLTPPYVLATADEQSRSPGTLLWGDALVVPSTLVSESAVVGDPALGVDAYLDRGLLGVNANGDLSTLSGRGCLGQALAHRLKTAYGSYLPHPTYGCELYGLLGLRNTPALMLLSGGLARRAALRDPRAIEVRVQSSIGGDVLALSVRATPVASDTPMDFNLVYQLPT